MENNEFMREKIKARPADKNKLVHKSIITLVLAVVFGLVACFTFLVLEPVISNILYPKDISNKVIVLPDDQEEMLPQDMVSEKINEEEEKEVVVLNDKQMKILIENVTFDRTDYQNIFISMSDYMEDLKQYMVEVVGIKEDTDWFFNVYESKYRTSGVIIAKNDDSYMILTDYNSIKKTDRVELTLFNGEKVPATIMNYHTASNLAILKVSMDDLSENTRKKGLSVASLGATYSDKIKGTIAVAMGCPLGTYGSVGYGIITAINSSSSMVDMDLQLLNTQINASTNATGVLFDMNGRVLGLIIPNKSTSDLRYTVTAYGISDLKKILNYMMEGKPFPYVGITGVNITDEVSEEYEIPYGIYVKDVALDSPAMKSGIQKGDILVNLDDVNIRDMGAYTDALMKRNIGDTISFGIMRQSQDSYKAMNFDVVIKQISE